MSRHVWGDPYRVTGRAWPVYPAWAYALAAWAALAWAVLA